MSKELEAIQKVAEDIKKFESDLSTKAGKAELKSMEEALAALKAAVAALEAEIGGEKMEDAVEEEVEKNMKSFKDFMKAAEIQLKEMKEDLNIAKEAGKRGSLSKSFGKAVVEALKKEKFLDTPLRKGEHRTVELKFNPVDLINKVAGTMTTGNVDGVGTNSIPFSLSDAELGLTRVQRRSPWIMQLGNVSNTTKTYVQWAEQENVDGGANETAEGSDKSQADFDWVEKSAKVEKITAYIKVSKEMLEDLDGLQNEIDTELREIIMLKADADLLSGDGTTPTIAGILTQDTAYSAGSFAGTIEQPNNYDVLRTAIAQIVAANFMPNYILLHPDDVAKMDLAKASDGHYVLPPFKSADGMLISGVRIVENTGQTVDKFTVGDFTKLNIRVREGLTIDIGLDGNDFTKNLVTILGEIRLASYIKSNHQAAFVSGDFSDAITALTATS